MNNKNKQSQKGFSLVELLMYVVITGAVAGLAVGVLTNVLKVQVRESASVEIMSQLNFVSQTIQRLVRESSLIETEAGTTTSTLKLRMADYNKDPTCISLVDGVIQLAEGPDSPWNLQNCTPTTSDLTTDKVVVNTLDFTKFSQYPGHDVVKVEIAMTSTDNPQVSQALRTGIARVTAATFDAGLYPGTTGMYDIGLDLTRWQNLYLSGGIQAVGDICTGAGGGVCLSTGGGGGEGTLTGGGTANYIAKWASATSLDSSVIYQFAGNVGIGTTGPDSNYKLHVEGKGVNIRNAANDIFVAMGDDGDLTTHLKVVSGGHFQVANNAASPLVTVQQGGNVGIGTITPDPNYKLTTTAGGVKAENSNATQPAGYFSNLGGGPALQTGSGAFVAGSGGITLGGVNQTSWPEGGGQWATSGTNIYNTNTGNVGIGTSAPEGDLHIVNTSAAHIKLRDTGSERVTMYYDDATNEFRTNLFAGNQNQYFSIDYDDPVFSFNTSSVTKALVIKKDGNVGIGTAGPVSLLHLLSSAPSNPVITIENTNDDAGSVAIHFQKNPPTMNNNDYVAQMMFYGDDSAGNVFGYGQIGVQAVDVTDGTEDGLMYLSVGSAGTAAGINNAQVVLKDGNVGIGTTDPDVGLHIKGPNPVSKLKLIDTLSQESGIYFGIPTNEIAGRIEYNHPANLMNFFTQSGTKMTILNNGNVGIGTTNPGTRLHILNSADSQVARFETPWNTGAYIQLKSTAIGGRTYNLYTTADADGVAGGGKFVIIDGTAGVYRLTLDSAGNVGIGTTNPNSSKGTGGYLDVKDVYIRDIGEWVSELSAAATYAP